MEDDEQYESHHHYDSSAPYNVPNRKERSRELAQKRRTTYKSLMRDLADELPFSKDVVSQIDYNSRLRLALCFFRTKSLMGKNPDQQQEKEKSLELVEVKSENNIAGMLQDLMVESLDGFLLITLGDGSIVFLSESVHKHLGLFQSEHIGFSLYDLIHEDDQSDVRSALEEAEVKVLSGKGSVKCSFFCRIKCSRFKVSNTAAKSPGYKLVFVSGHFKVTENEPFFVAVARPVSPPSILEIRMDGNMYVTHYTLDFKCCFFDGRLNHLIGFDKSDLLGHLPFEFHHHEDVYATLDCAKGLMTRGEGLSAYYRLQNKFGQYIWMQSRATMMFDSRTGRPSYIVCMNYVVNKDEGERYHSTRRAIQPAISPIDTERSHDPFPVPRSDNNQPNPFADFMSMMAKNMGGMAGMGGMASMMGALMGGGGGGDQMKMPSPPSQACKEEPTSTVLDIARSSSTSPDSGLSSCSTSASPISGTIPDSTTESICSFDNADSIGLSKQRYSESSGSFDDGYSSGAGNRFSLSATSSPLMMDAFSPYSDTFLPASKQSPTTQTQVYIKEEYSRMSPVSAGSSLPGVSPSYDTKYHHYSNPMQLPADLPPSLNTSSYNPHCRYSSAHVANSHIKQEQSMTSYLPDHYPMPAHSYTSATPHSVPVTITAESFPATLPILKDTDLQILDLETNLHEHLHPSHVPSRNPLAY